MRILDETDAQEDQERRNVRAGWGLMYVHQTD